MATDELASILYTCGGSKGTVLVSEWYEPWEKLVPQGPARYLVYITFQNI